MFFKTNVMNKTRISKKTVRPIFFVKGGEVTPPNPAGQGGPPQ